jgi:hypothetical protein
MRCSEPGGSVAVAIVASRDMTRLGKLDDPTQSAVLEVLGRMFAR